MHRADSFRGKKSKTHCALGLRFLAGLEIDGIPPVTDGGAYTRPRHFHEPNLVLTTTPSNATLAYSLLYITICQPSIHRHVNITYYLNSDLLMEFRSLACLSTRNFVMLSCSFSFYLGGGQFWRITYHISFFVFPVLPNPPFFTLVLRRLSKHDTYTGSFFVHASCRK
jgi:hypothetical protein